MFETIRMLGHEHEADLAREAERRRLAALLPRRRREPGGLGAARRPVSAPTLRAGTPRVAAGAGRPR
jgi:hypothetical protein